MQHTIEKLNSMIEKLKFHITVQTKEAKSQKEHIDELKTSNRSLKKQIDQLRNNHIKDLRMLIKQKDIQMSSVGAARLEVKPK